MSRLIVLERMLMAQDARRNKLAVNDSVENLH